MIPRGERHPALACRAGSRSAQARLLKHWDEYLLTSCRILGNMVPSSRESSEGFSSWAAADCRVQEGGMVVARSISVSAFFPSLRICVSVVRGDY